MCTKARWILQSPRPFLGKDLQVFFLVCLGAGKEGETGVLSKFVGYNLSKTQQLDNLVRKTQFNSPGGNKEGQFNKMYADYYAS